MDEHDKLREAIKEARQHWYPGTTGARILEPVLAAAESTLPKTKMVEVWRVEWARQNSRDQWMPASVAFTSKAEADDFVVVAQSAGHACIHITGPHQQEVPA